MQNSVETTKDEWNEKVVIFKMLKKEKRVLTIAMI
jgi:hypothetical protein